MGYPKFNPLGDVVSGIIMATTSIPQLIAYAETVGYSSYRGLTTAGLPLLIWGILTGHPYINIGVTNLTALMTKSDLNGEIYIQEYGEQSYIELVAVYTLLIGFITIFFALIGFGKIASKVPKVVRSGSRYGSSIGVLLSAIPNGFLKHGSNDLKIALSKNIFYQQYIIGQPFIKSKFPGFITISQCFICLCHPFSLWDVEPTIMFIIGTLFVMYNGAKYCYIPSFLIIPGIEVIIVTLLAVLYSLYMDYNGAIVGTIPETDSKSGIHLWNGRISIPVDLTITDWNQVTTLLPLLIQQVAGGSYIQFGVTVFMFAGVSFIGFMGLASVFEVEDNIPWDPSRELTALGISNGVAAAVGSAPIAASLSRSLVSRMTGTSSQVASIVTAFCWIYLLPYMKQFLTPIPKAALSAIIVSAVFSGIIYPKDVLAFNSDGIEHAIVAWGTAILTATTNPTKGFTYGLLLHFFIMSIFQRVRKSRIDQVPVTSSSKEKNS